MHASQTCAVAVVAALVRSGVRHVVLCPGSRSAPLAYAVADAERAGGLAVHVRTDERAAAFTALGIGRVGAGPAAVVTTSGTAVANLHPAVLEAHHGGVPLLLLTADRPHALRGTWANQTSDLQPGIFGRAVRRSLDLEAPGPGADPAVTALAWAEAVQDVVDASRGVDGRPGPVQVDLAFAEPLVPAEGPAPDGPRLPERRRRPRRRGDEVHPLPDGPRTVVVAGDTTADDGWAARWTAEAGGWPLLAEPSSGARSGPCAVPAYRLLLGRPELGGRVERVVVHGRPTLSRPVTALLADPAVEVVHVVADEGEPGPTPRPGLVRVRGLAVPEEVLEAPRGWHAQRALAPDAWLSAWLRAGAAAAAAVDGVLDADAADGALSGPLLGREVAAATTADDVLVLAASTAVRDVDLAAVPFVEPVLDAQRSPSPPPFAPGTARLVLAGRGLAGIDGTLSTAVGAALGSGRRTRALVGDLAFLHDLAGLSVPAGERSREAIPGAPAQVQVVVLDDGGGGIFSTLEHGGLAGREADVERLFGTPTGADLVTLAGGLGVPSRRVHGLGDLHAALCDPDPGLSVLVVPADRTALRGLHARIGAAVGVALDALPRP